jgi:hypothetical protein
MKTVALGRTGIPVSRIGKAFEAIRNRTLVKPVVRLKG